VEEGYIVMKFRDCETCLVYGTDNKPLSRARVENDEKGRVILFFNNYKLRNIRFKTYVDFYDMQQGLMRSWCELVIHKNTRKDMAEPWMADVKVLKVEDVFQRQKDLRVRVNISTSFSTDRGEYFSGTIKNISAGGIFLVTSKALQPDTKFSFSYRFDGESCKVTAKVLRARGVTAGGFGYGCQFVRLLPETEARIRKFVFAKQMENQSEKQKGQERRG